MKNYRVEISGVRDIYIDCTHSLDENVKSPDEDYNIEVDNPGRLYYGLIPIDIAKDLAAEIIANTSDATHIHIDPNEGNDYTIDFVRLNVIDKDTEEPTEADRIQIQIDDHYRIIEYLKKQKDRLTNGDSSDDDDLPF